MERQIIKQEAKDALVGNRVMFLLSILLVFAAIGVTAGLGSLVAPVLTSGIFLIGKELLFNKKFNFQLIIEYFKDLNHALKLIAVNLLFFLIVAAGTLLFIIPSIIFAFQFSQVNFIMAENKDLDIWDAFKQSRAMMKGYKFDLFIFNLSFFWHYLLVMITFGLYMFYLLPYLQLAKINYYVHLKEVQNTDNIISI